ncbi:MAG TPA: excinuclease ABC subunit UvrC [Candidatus Dormibacteraeota bacterium]|jgi:excinuclease ABC subunit C|nr:excinuclease ABC subunit UvrC [Candidatus Dormibacteraeota bacterium]
MTPPSTRPARQARLIDNPELLRERLRAAPDSPGVYLMRDLDARVVYVGKAANLRARLRSYFTAVSAQAARTRHLVERIFDFETIACLNEREALILENTLIKRYRPRFNVRLKDDKNYLYLKIPRPGARDTAAPGTAREEARRPRGEGAARAASFPRPYYSRRLARDGAQYFGPYTNAQSLRTTVRSLRTIFPFRTCSDEIFRRGHVCLDYHIKRCSGPCEARITPEAYSDLLEQVQLFMDGKSSVLTGQLDESMREAAERLDYEQAARYRDRLRAVERVAEKQKMLRGGRNEHDCVAVALDGGRGMVALFAVREGRVTGMETHELEGVADLTPAECLGSFVSQFYGSAPHVPRTILLSDEIDDAGVVADFLAEQRGGPVELRVPQRGALRQLTEQARETAQVAMRQQRIKEDFDAERSASLLADLQLQLDLPEPPRRIECYDISNTMGTNSVGSMVVFEDGRPRPGHYRFFGIKTVEGANDFASMQETLRRRFARWVQVARREAAGELDDVPVDDPAGSNGGTQIADAESEEGTVADITANLVDAAVNGANGHDDASPHNGSGTPRDSLQSTQPSRVIGRRGRKPRDPDEDSFGVLPDLVLIDGGKGQLNAARTVLDEAGLTDIPVFGLAKQNEELFRPGVSEPIVLPRDSPTLFLVQRVRDEAHRFAITRHRARRSKAALRSKLDVVPGLGPTRKRALLRRFGSVEGIREASVEDLSSEVPRSVALRVKELL